MECNTISLFALLLDKNENNYNRLFKTLKNLKYGLRPNTETRGRFSFSQVVWRHVQSCGLQAKYSEVQNFLYMFI
jgi:hypothetical protein